MQSLYITPIVTQIWVQHNQVLAPILGNEILQRNYRKMIIHGHFPINSFVKLSLYRMIHIHALYIVLTGILLIGLKLWRSVVHKISSMIRGIKSQIKLPHDTVKPVLSVRIQKDLKLGFKTNYSLMQVKSIAECSKRAFCNTFNLH